MREGKPSKTENTTNQECPCRELLTSVLSHFDTLVKWDKFMNTASSFGAFTSALRTQLNLRHDRANRITAALVTSFEITIALCSKLPSSYSKHGETLVTREKDGLVSKILAYDNISVFLNVFHLFQCYTCSRS